MQQGASYLFGFADSSSCETTNSWSIGFNTTAFSMDYTFWGSPAFMPFTNPSSYDDGHGSYTGYNAANPCWFFRSGFFSIMMATRRLGTSVGSTWGQPFPQAARIRFTKMGDIWLNTAPVSGGNVGWIKTSGGWLTFGVAGSGSGVCCGNVVQSDIPIGSAISVTSGVPKTITSVSLTAGDWDCRGQGVTNAAGSTTTNGYEFGLSTTNNVFGAGETGGNNGIVSMSGTIINTFAPVGTYRFNLGSTTTVYLIGQVNFAVSTMAVYGSIQCRQMG